MNRPGCAAATREPEVACTKAYSVMPPVSVGVHGDTEGIHPDSLRNDRLRTGDSVLLEVRHRGA